MLLHLNICFGTILWIIYRIFLFFWSENHLCQKKWRRKNLCLQKRKKIRLRKEICKPLFSAKWRIENSSGRSTWYWKNPLYNTKFQHNLDPRGKHYPITFFAFSDIFMKVSRPHDTSRHLTFHLMIHVVYFSRSRRVFWFERIKNSKMRGNCETL